MRALRVLLSGLAAALAWWLGLAVVFGPAQHLLADPQRQSGVLHRRGAGIDRLRSLE